MPRPTAAQIAYGTATVVCSTIVMLLLSRTGSGIAVAVVTVAALGLGLLVAATVPLAARVPRTARVSPRAEGVSVPRIPGQRTGGSPRPGAGPFDVRGGAARRPDGVRRGAVPPARTPRP
ncbi:hypothetical protein [Streptomyces sp. NPDC049906]|uniref:hypothetical protein n=1 Tax=Streptomyces sp. NPDC049906 TaxID=3155656 RepID=UPI00342F1B4A